MRTPLPALLLFVAALPLAAQTDGTARLTGVMDRNPANNEASATVDFGNETFASSATINRYFVASTTSDDGPGSLRQALLEAQQQCETGAPCKVGFEIPGPPADGRFVIQPLTALPEIRGVVTVDGSTQTRFGGDTNPNGPEIEIDGSLVQGPTPGGLVLGSGCAVHVYDLAITNFPAPGVTVHSSPYDFQACFPVNGGQDCFEDYPYCYWPVSALIARNHISRNYRGIAVVGPGNTGIEDNVITDNQRAGVFTERNDFVRILRNRITGNGASGIFLDVGVREFHPSARVEENVVTGNAEWGIARIASGDVNIRRNSVFGNRYSALDVGLDLDTPNRARDEVFDRGVPNKPVLIAAEYDPVANKTVVRGRLDSDRSPVSSAPFRIDVYASSGLSASGHGNTERWLTTVLLPDGHTDLLIELEGDLRGSYITATNTRGRLFGFDIYLPNTSELSNAVTVR